MSAELVTLADDPAALDRLADPGAYVIAACEHAKTWLAYALEHGEIDKLVELKSQAEAIRVYTAAKQYGRDAELSAAEIVRRAERGIGLAIKKAQGSGEVRRQGQSRAKNIVDQKLVSPTEFYNNAQEGHEIRVQASASDDQFDEAIAEAKAEENLSRANVVRKVQGVPSPAPQNGRTDRSRVAVTEREHGVRKMAGEGYTSVQIAESLGIGDEAVVRIAARLGVDIPANAAMGRTRNRKYDADRIVSTIVHDLEGARISIKLVDYTTLDRDQIPTWIDSLTESVKAVQALKNALVKESNRVES